jgi:MFS family permease
MTNNFFSKELPIMRTKSYPWIVWGLAAAFFFSEYFARVAPGVMVPDLMRDFKVTALTLGSLSAFFYYAYVGMQVPVGILVDRFGPHRLLTVATVLCGAGCLLFASAQSVGLAEAGRFLMGFGASFAFVGTLKLAAVWFPATQFGLLAGLTQALGMLGASVGEAPMSFSVGFIGWRSTMFLVASIFVVLAFFIGFIVRDRPKGMPPARHELATGANLLAGLQAVLANPQSWYNALYAGFLYAPTAAFAELWGVAFLTRTYGLRPHLAATGVGLIFIGWGVGGPIVGWLSDHIRRRRSIMIASAVLSFILISLVLFTPSLSVSALFTILFLYGVANTGVATAYAVSTEINPRPVAGTSLAFANMASVLVGAAFQPLIGWFLDLHWDGKMLNGAPFYSSMDFHLAMILLPVCLVLAFVAALFVRETYCEPHKI